MRCNAFYPTDYDLEINAGLIDRTKKASFSLFFEKAIILPRFFANSAINA